MPGKPLNLENLAKDLDYLRNGIIVHDYLKFVCEPTPGLQVLETGCGSGKLGLWYALRGARVVLIDIDKDVLKYTDTLMNMAGASASIICGSVHKLSKMLTGYEFDFVFSEGTTHQWPSSDWRRQSSINQMVKMCRIGGKVCVIGSNGACKDMVEYAEKVDHTYMGMPKKQEPLMPSELALRLKKAGLANINVQPVGGRWDNSMLLCGWGEKK